MKFLKTKMYLESTSKAKKTRWTTEMSPNCCLRIKSVTKYLNNLIYCRKMHCRRVSSRAKEDLKIARVPRHMPIIFPPNKLLSHFVVKSEGTLMNLVICPLKPIRCKLAKMKALNLKVPKIFNLKQEVYNHCVKFIEHERKKFRFWWAKYIRMLTEKMNDMSKSVKRGLFHLYTKLFCQSWKGKRGSATMIYQRKEFLLFSLLDIDVFVNRSESLNQKVSIYTIVAFFSKIFPFNMLLTVNQYKFFEILPIHSHITLNSMKSNNFFF